MKEELLTIVLKELFDSFEIINLRENKSMCSYNVEDNLEYDEKEFFWNYQKYLIRVSKYNNVDELTKLPKRYSVSKRISEYKKNNVPFLMVMIDVDEFKKINDTYGHPTGDEVLKCIANIIKSKISSKDLLVRWGGDEFLALLSEIEISKLCERFEDINNRLRSGVFINGISISLSISYGIISYDKSRSFEENYQDADKLLYDNKIKSKIKK